MEPIETQKKARPDSESGRAQEPRRRKHYNTVSTIPLDEIRAGVRSYQNADLEAVFDFVAPAVRFEFAERAR